MIDTIHLIHNTFAQMLSEEGSKLAVQHIAERAGISRNTFYYYYESIEPLAGKLLDGWFDCTDEPDAGSLHDCMRPLLEKCLAHKAQILRLCGSPYKHVLMSRLHSPLLDRLRSFTRERLAGFSPDETSGTLGLYDHILMAFLEHWLGKNMSYDMRRYTDQLDRNFNVVYPPKKQ